jgi:hypothetical protein
MRSIGLQIRGHPDADLRKLPKPGEWLQQHGGNFGQAVAFAASRHGLSATIVVPHGNSAEKNRALRGLGAELIEHGEDFQSALVRSEELARERGLYWVPSFQRGHPAVVCFAAVDYLFSRGSEKWALAESSDKVGSDFSSDRFFERPSAASLQQWPVSIESKLPIPHAALYSSPPFLPLGFSAIMEFAEKDIGWNVRPWGRPEIRDVVDKDVRLRCRIQPASGLVLADVMLIGTE